MDSNPPFYSYSPPDIHIITHLYQTYPPFPLRPPLPPPTSLPSLLSLLTLKNSKQPRLKNPMNQKVHQGTRVVFYGSQDTIGVSQDGDAEKGRSEVYGSSLESSSVGNGDGAPFDSEDLDRDLGVDVEVLGRKRPESLPSALREFGFCFSILISMVMCVSPRPLQHPFTFHSPLIRPPNPPSTCPQTSPPKF